MIQMDEMDKEWKVCVFVVGTVEGELFIQSLVDRDGRLCCVEGQVDKGQSGDGYDGFIDTGKSLTGLSKDRKGKVWVVDGEKSGIPERDATVRTEWVVIDVGEHAEGYLMGIRSRKESRWMNLCEDPALA